MATIDEQYIGASRVGDYVARCRSQLRFEVLGARAPDVALATSAVWPIQRVRLKKERGNIRGDREGAAVSEAKTWP